MAGDKKGVKNTVITVIFILMIGAAVFAGYFFFKKAADERARKNNEQKNEPTEIEKIIAVNLDIQYPETARAVVKFYCRVVKAFHDVTPEDAELSKLQYQLRKIYDDELNENNNVTDQFKQLKSEILEYDSLNRTIDDYVVDAAGNSETWTADGQSFYRIIANFTLKENGKYFTLYEEFLLRKDDAGKWKIVGWRRVDKDGLTNK
ncbi:MAG: hypothetical protein J6U10_07620 [Lachnospiraceae bacterium]|nr:hypothetical protein [Lachnospiraceae bacterium]